MDNRYPLCPPLQKEIKCDVLIIGGGMSGISAAVTFIGKGLKVVVLEKSIIGGSSSGRSAGFLTPDSELELSQLIRRYGIEGAKKLWEVPVHGIELIKSHVEKYKIECDFRKQDSLFLGIGTDGKQDVEDEMSSRQSVGFTNQKLYDENSLKNILKSEGFTAAVRYDQTYGIDSLQYLQGMKNILVENGIEVFENTEVHSISGNTAITHSGKVTADQIVVAMDKMDSKFNQRANEIFHAQTFLSISEPLNDREIQEMFPTGEEFQMWDSTLVYSYWRLVKGNRVLLGGGNALTTFLKQAWYHEGVIDGVHSRFKSHFPFLKSLRFTQYWPGLIDNTRDLLPTIVKDSNNPSIHFILGVVGLPWASFSGNFVARNILNEADAEDQKYYDYFSDRRYFAFPMWLEKLFGKPILFSLSTGWAKYYQKDINHKLPFLKGEF